MTIVSPKSSIPMQRLSKFFITTAACSLALSSSVIAETANWSQWRGPDRKDHSPDTGLLKKWPEKGPKQLWIYKNAGLGYAGPAIVDGKLYTMGAREKKTILMCLDAASGKELWASELDEELENDWGNGPRCTPTIDGAFVYALGGRGTLISAKIADGSEVWKVNLVKDFGGKVESWGYTESVLVDGDRLICTPGGSEGALLALDRKTGKKIWQSEELTVKAQYASPIVVEHAGVRQYIQLFEKDFAGFEAANGKVLWKSDFPKGKVAVIPTPIYEDGIVYITAGYKAGCKAIKLGPNHEVETIYEHDDMSNHHGGVILVDGYLYGYHSSRGGWTCQNFKTGKVEWTDRTLGKGAIGYADDMIYCVGERDGKVILADASSKEWKAHGEFTLDPQTEIRSDRGAIWVHPVILNGRLYLRDQDLIYCYDVSGK
ncbi:MAG: outer membrane protein assembly factor BamB [Verrucomicrobiales bacterium]|jgi:outer membrane protein assembly factor BamB